MNTTPDNPMTALDEAIAKADGVKNLAERIGVGQSTVSMWKARGRVPAENCPAIERETGVRCERLCPGVPWDVLRQQCAHCEAATP